MAMPPKDIEPSALFLKLTQSRPHKLVDLPRKGPDGEPIGQVAMWILTQEELIAVAAESERKTRKLLGSDIPGKEQAKTGYDDVYQNTAACELLFKACRDADDPTKPAFRTPSEIQKAFSNDEIGVLQFAYLTVQSELGPIESQLSDDEFEAWVRVLAEGASALPFAALSWGALTALALRMASQLWPLLQGKSSPGSEPSEPSSEGNSA